jgi:DNA-binding MarR family transcriptional regulator
LPKRIAEKKGAQELGRIADLTHGAAIRLLRFVRREDAAAGLSAPQLSALSVLVYGGPQAISALAAAEQVRPPTMSRLVDDLEHLGLAERLAKPGDRRVYQVRVTDAGRSLLEEGRRKRLARLVEILGDASPSELRALQSAAKTIVRLTDSTILSGATGQTPPALSSASYAPPAAKTRSTKHRLTIHARNGK